MEEKNILVTQPVTEAQKEELKGIFPEGEFRFAVQPNAEDMRDVQIILGDVPPEIAAAEPKLEWLQLSSSGVEPYIKPGLLRPGVVLTSATGAYGAGIAEYLLAGTLALLRDFRHCESEQRAHHWVHEANAGTVFGSRTLVVGLGSIGGEYGKRMKALGSHVVGIRRHAAEKPDWLDEMYDLSALDAELPKADIVALSLPSTPKTFHIMDSRRFHLMKKSALFLNVGRGNAVVTDDLTSALQSGEFAGACLDVTDPEPLPEDHPLWDLPNVILTPHISGWTKQKDDEIFHIIRENLHRYCADEPLRNRVDPKEGYRGFETRF